MKVRREKTKTRRKILAVVLSVCMVFTASPNLWDGVVARAAEVVQSGTFDGTNLTWTLDADGVLTISGSGAMTDFNGSTRKAPFYQHRGSIKKVVIQDGVTSIGEWTFYEHEALESVTISDSVKSIGKGAFDQCTALKDVNLPREMTSIGKQAFNICSSLTSIVIPKGVTSIEDYTFSSCDSLVFVSIPEGVTSIGWQAFCGCYSLSDVTIPESVTSIKEQAFCECALMDVTIPGSVTSIGYNAFEDCSRLGTVTFQGTTTIPTLDEQYGGVFAGCQFVTRNEKGIHVPSCQYLSQEGWSNYESYIADAPHIKFSYTVDGAVITQSCANCDEKLGTATISVDSGADLNYTGSEIKPAKVTYSDGWVEDNNKPDNTAITYENNINAGTATAKLTIGGATAQINFTIKATSYTVTLHTNGGTGGTSLTSYTYGTGAKLPTNWTKKGYVFDGWYVNEDFTGTVVTNILADDTGNKEYWAKWTDNIAPVIGTLSFNYQPKNLWQWLIGKESLVITVPVTEEGSGADKITYTETPDGGTAREETANIQNGEAEITVSADFKGTISIACTDKANNTSASVTVGAGVAPNGIIIEDNAPQIAFTAENAELLPSGEYKSVPNITVTVADDKNNAISGGIASVSYKIGSGSAKTVLHDYTTSMVLHDSFTIPASEIPAGETKITVTATDNAGNSVTQNYTVKVHSHGGTLVQAVEPTCTTAGNDAYYTCTCGKWFSDSGCTNEITDHTEVIKNALGHDFTGEYQFDTEEHWKKCSRCDATDSREAHSFEEGGIHCTRCEFEKAGEGHTHTGELHQRVEPTCTTEGNTAYYTCTCGKWFSDSGCTVEITDHASVAIPALGHDFSGEYQSDASEHWKVCSRCHAGQPKEPHVFDDDNDADCNKCGYRRNNENQGNVSKDVEKDEKAPDTVLSESAEELADIILTEVEKGQIGNGADIKFILDVKDAGDTVSSSDKTSVQQALDGNTVVKGFSVGQYLDINLFKVIGGIRNAISQTARKLTIVINVPESLKSKDGAKPRTYSIIRVHDDVAEALPDLDSDADTVTIATDRFSAYALVYKEAGSGADVTPTPTPGGGDNVTPVPAPSEKPEKTSSKEKRKIQLYSGLKAIQTGKKLQISWGRVSGADGYSVYVQYCSKNFSARSLNQVKSGKKTKITVKKVNGKKLDTTKNYKLYVVAWQWKDGKKSSLAKTLTIHVAGKDSVKYTNVKSIQAGKSFYTLKKGGTVTLHPKAVLYDKRKKQLSVAHCKEFRYLSSNKKIATITAGGKVKAKGTGECTIYIFAKNGYKRKIKVKVK